MATLGKLVYQAAARSHPSAAQLLHNFSEISGIFMLASAVLASPPSQSMCRCSMALMHYIVAGSRPHSPQIGGLAYVCTMTAKLRRAQSLGGGGAAHHMQRPRRCRTALPASKRCICSAPDAHRSDHDFERRRRHTARLLHWLLCIAVRNSELHFQWTSVPCVLSRTVHTATRRPCNASLYLEEIG